MVQATGGHREALGPGSAPYSRVPIGSLCASLRQLDAPLSISKFASLVSQRVRSLFDRGRGEEWRPSPKSKDMMLC